MDTEQNNYNQPIDYDKMAYPHMTMGDWLITFLILCIPCVNIVMVFIWAFGSDVNPSKKTFFQAYLIIVAVVFAFYILMFAVGAAAGLANYMDRASAFINLLG